MWVLKPEDTCVWGGVPVDAGVYLRMDARLLKLKLARRTTH